MKNTGKHRRNIIGGISQKTELPLDTVSGAPYITMYADREIVIEGKCRILEYTKETICVSCRMTRIRICGRNLLIRLMDDVSLCAGGVILSVCFEE